MFCAWRGLNEYGHKYWNGYWHEGSSLVNHAHPLLDQQLQQMLPGSYVRRQHLAACPELQLWLVAPECINRPFSAEEQQRIAAYPAYWAVCWPGGLAMARYILDHPQLVRNKAVLDLGCGSGLVAIAAARAGAKRVIACDLDQQALAACRANAELNQTRQNNNELEFCTDFHRTDGIDIVLAADLLYDHHNHTLLDEFMTISQQVWLSESRAADIQHPAFDHIGQHHYATEPDSGHPDPYATSLLYCSRPGAKQ
tara:strand:+ start:8157 stop:8918 length:762 start_codon:yes stop_codon:yes gene_type:complete